MTRERPNTFVPAGDPLDNVSEFQPRIVRPTTDPKEAEKVAAEIGFTAREAKGAQEAPTQKIIDARSLRKTSRTAQLNISVSPGTKERFWQFAIADRHETGEQALLALLDRVPMSSG